MAKKSKLTNFTALQCAGILESACERILDRIMPPSPTCEDDPGWRVHLSASLDPAVSCIRRIHRNAQNAREQNEVSRLHLEVFDLCKELVRYTFPQSSRVCHYDQDDITNFLNEVLEAHA